MSELSFDRRFSLHLFWAGHGVMLLRSGVSNEHSTQVDVLFRDVVWMSLPTWLEGLTVEVGELNEVRPRLPERIVEEAALRTTFRIRTENSLHYVIGGSVSVAEERAVWPNHSSLLPGLVFPSFS